MSNGKLPDHEKYLNVNAPLLPGEWEAMRPKTPPKSPPPAPHNKMGATFSSIKNIILSDDSLSENQKSSLIERISKLY